MGQITPESLALATIGLGGMIGIAGILSIVVVSLMLALQAFHPHPEEKVLE
jgi:hypothetical protein